MDPGKRKLEISDDEFDGGSLGCTASSTGGSSSSSAAARPHHNHAVVIDPIVEDDDSSLPSLSPSKRRSIIHIDRDSEEVHSLDDEREDEYRLRPSLLPPLIMTIHEGHGSLNCNSHNNFIDALEVISAASAGSDLEDNVMDDIIAMRNITRNIVHIVPPQEDDEGVGGVEDIVVVNRSTGINARTWLAAPAQSRRAVRIGDDYQAEIDR